MTIDGIDISAFHTVLSDFPDIQPATVVTYSDWLRQAINPLCYGLKETYKVIKLTFFIKDTDYQSCLDDVSNLCHALKKCTIKFDDISYCYDCALSATPASTLKVRDNRLSVTVTLNSAYAYLPAVTTILSGTSQTLTAQGNLPSPATVTLTPSQNIGTLTLSGLTKKPVTVNNLHAGAPVVIDGEKCTVTEADLNKFPDTDLWAFPTVQPGDNAVTVDSSVCSVTISYKPKFM